MWEAATGFRVRTLHGHSDRVKAVCFSPDGTRIVSASDDKTLIVWDAIALYQIIGDYSNDGGTIHSTLASSINYDDDSSVRIFELRPLRSYPDWLAALCYSPDGTLVVTSYGDEGMCVWEAATGHHLYILQAFSHVPSASFATSSTIRASTCDGNYTWSVCPKIAAYSKDLKTIMFKNDSGYECWNVQTGERVPYDPTELEIGPPVTYQQVPDVKIDRVLGRSGLACYGVKLEGAIISKNNLDIINFFIRTAS